MITFYYTARNPSTGEQVKSSIEAQSDKDAAKQIKENGLTVISIKAESAAGLKSLHTDILNRVKSKDRVLFARQLSTLINAGLPLSQSLRNVADQTTSKPLKVIVNSLISDIEGGQQLSAAMSKYPKVFNKVFVSLIASGEASGTLDKSLDRVAIQQEKDADVVSKLRGAMIYPIIVVLVMIAVITFMLVKVLPQVNVLYQAFPGASLPIETRILLALSHFASHFWWIVLIVVIIAGIGGNRWAKTTSGTRVFDTLKLKAPPFSKLFQKVYMARFSRTSCSLVGAGVPILQVLKITSDSVSNVLVSDSINKAAEKVKSGKSLSSALEGDPNFLTLVPSMLHIGEESGSMEQMMERTADYYEREVDDEIKNISATIEPIMMVMLGVAALVIVAAVLLPVYGLAASGAVSGGGV